MISQTIRRFNFAAAAAVLIAGGLQAATIGTGGWIRVTPLGGSFSVSMPGVPEHKTSPLYSKGGSQHSAQLPAGFRAVYLCGVLRRSAFVSGEPARDTR